MTLSKQAVKEEQKAQVLASLSQTHGWTKINCFYAELKMHQLIKTVVPGYMV